MSGLTKNEQAVVDPEQTVVDPNEKKELLYRASDKVSNRDFFWRNKIDKRLDIELRIANLKSKLND